MQNSKSKEFNQKFNQQIQDIKLPDKISDKYTITSILKETDNKCVYIISDAKKELYMMFYAMLLPVIFPNLLIFLKKMTIHILFAAI